MKSKLRIISELFYPSTDATAHIISKLAVGLCDKFVVSVICSSTAYGSKGIDNNEFKNENYQGISIYRIATTPFNKNKIFLRLVRQLLISIRLFWQTIRQTKRNELLFVVTNPPFLLVLISALAYFRKQKLVILVHDVFPNNLVAADILSEKSFVYRAINLVFRWAYSKATKVIVIGRDMKMLIDKHLPPNKKSIIITNWADLDSITPSPKSDNPILTKLGLQDKFVLLFAGNLGRLQALEYWIQCATHCQNTNIHFLFIGNGAYQKHLSQQIKELSLDNITLLDSMPRYEQNIFLNACDVGLVSLSKGMYGLGVPSKSYNILAAGKPILYIGDDGSEITQMLEQHQVGLAVGYDVNQVLDAIYSLVKNAHTLDSNRIRAIAESNFAFKIILNKYIYTLQEVINQ